MRTQMIDKINRQINHWQKNWIRFKVCRTADLKMQEIEKWIVKCEMESYT